MTTFRHHVGNVGRLLPGKKMGGIHAWGEIAVMKDSVTFWNRPAMQLPRKTVCENYSAVVFAIPKYPVPELRVIFVE